MSGSLIEEGGKLIERMNGEDYMSETSPASVSRERMELAPRGFTCSYGRAREVRGVLEA